VGKKIGRALNERPKIYARGPSQTILNVTPVCAQKGPISFSPEWTEAKPGERIKKTWVALEGGYLALHPAISSLVETPVRPTPRSRSSEIGSVKIVLTGKLLIDSVGFISSHRKTPLKTTTTTPEPIPSLPPSLRKFDKNGDSRLSDKEISEIEKFPQKELEGIAENTAYSVILEILSAAKTVHQKLAPTKEISFDEFRILMRLQRAEQEGGHVIQENLVEELGLSPSRVSSILNAIDASLPLPEGQAKRATSRPWIKRRDDPSRRLQKLVSLTEEGKKVLTAARPEYMRQIYKAVKAVGFRDLLQLRVALYRLNVALDPNHTTIDTGSGGG
jgi:DNA-binding MarR family transcriptional regulator